MSYDVRQGVILTGDSVTPRGSPTDEERSASFVKLNSKMIWLVIFHSSDFDGKWNTIFIHISAKAWALPCHVSHVILSPPEFGADSRKCLGVQASSGEHGFPHRALETFTSQGLNKRAKARGIWIWMSRLLSSYSTTGWKVLGKQVDEALILNKCQWTLHSFKIG